MKYFFRIGFAVSVMSVAFLWRATFAAAAQETIFMESEPQMPVQGSEFIVRIFAASDQPVNGYEIAVSFQPNKVELVYTDTARSLIDIWPKQPLVYMNGDVRWSGASIAPFMGVRGELFALHLRALPGVSTTTVSIRTETALYLANGKGTKVIPRSQGLSLTFAPAAETGGQAPGDMHAEPRDNVPPAISFIALEKDPITPGQKLLSFQAGDHESGIANVETRTRSWFVWSNWQTTRNPDALGSGVWEAQVRVTDHAGNVASATVHDWRTAGAKAAIAACTVIVLLWFARAIMTRRRYSGRSV